MRVYDLGLRALATKRAKRWSSRCDTRNEETLIRIVQGVVFFFFF